MVNNEGVPLTESVLKLQAEDNLFYNLTNKRSFKGYSETKLNKHRQTVLNGYNKIETFILKALIVQSKLIK